MIIFHIETRRRLRCCSEPWTGFRLLPWDRKDKKDRTGLVFSVILDTLIISQAPLLSQDVIYYALTLSFTKFPHKTKACGNWTSLAHNCGLVRLDYDEIFKVSLLIRKNLLESAKRLWLTLHIEHQYHLIHQRAIRISKQNTKVQTAKTDCAIAWSKVCLRNLTPRKYYRKTGTEKVFNANFSRKNQYLLENIHSVPSIILDKNWFCGYYIEKGADLNGDYNKREHSQSSECL